MNWLAKWKLVLPLAKFKAMGTRRKVKFLSSTWKTTSRSVDDLPLNTLLSISGKKRDAKYVSFRIIKKKLQ